MKINQNKLGRNDLCPCGSGNKYKRCCLSSDKTLPLHSQRTGDIVQLKSAERLGSRVKKNMGNNCTLLHGSIGGIKMSGVILDLADFLLDAAKTEAQQQSAITITCLGWNIAVLGDQEGQKFFDEYFETMGDPVHQQDTLDIINVIVKRKKDYYPDINRVILDYELVGDFNNLHLNIVSTVPEESVSELKQEQVNRLVVNNHY